MTVIDRPVIEYYYETHEIEEEMPESIEHALLLAYLVSVVQWMFRLRAYAVLSNVNIYVASRPGEKPVAPDVALLPGIDPLQLAAMKQKSWYVAPPDRPAPCVVLEIASDSTVSRDLLVKPEIYGAMGVREYIYYDPRPGTPAEERLRGWQYPAPGIAEEMELDGAGRLWSRELESWLQPDGSMLRLIDSEGRRRPSAAEAAVEAARAELRATRGAAAAARAVVEAEKAESQSARAAAEAEKAAAEAEKAAAEAEKAAAEAEAQKQRAWAKLRELGFDPEQLR